jgi:hypothetical protein
MPTGVVEPPEELLELWLALVLLLLVWLDWDPVGPLPELPDAQAPAVKQNEKIPAKAMESTLLSIVNSPVCRSRHSPCNDAPLPLAGGGAR